MDRSHVCKLINATHTKNEYGVFIESETETEVFCQIQSVTGNEWHNAGVNGIKAEYKITLFKYDYDGQETVKLNDAKYAIYRTYERDDDFIELYLNRRVGA